MSIFELSFQSGEASLSVRRVVVQEAVSELFSVSVWARSRLSDLELESLVGQSASLQIQPDAAHLHWLNSRLWQGVCSHVEQVQAEPTGLSTYYLRIVPRLWLLTQRRGHRIYQHLSIPDIVDALLGEWAIEPAWKIDRGAYPRLEYRVQHGESDHAFLSRLLEEAGIAYTFPDRGADTKLTLSDKLEAEPLRPGPPLPYVDNPLETAEREFVTRVRLGHEVRPGASTIRGHDFRKPSFALTGEAPAAPAPEAKYEQYRYEPGAFLAASAGGGAPIGDAKGVYRHDPKHGADLSTRVLAAMRADKRGVLFEANVIDLYPGRVFAVDQHPHPELGKGPLMAAELEIVASLGEPWSVRGRALFADPTVPYRPARKTPRPVAPGLQSATVVGPPGAEIHTDELGRVRVQFPWDREGKLDDNSSCWMRVSQGWAGAGFGMFMLPRVGQEVLVAFLDGDPDLPIVAGRAFNGRELVPYKLPDHKTVSTWKSSSSPGGEGYNEIKFEDQAGQELVYMQAQRDRNQLVKRDEVERTARHKRSTVGGDEHLVVKGARKQLVHGGDHVHVKLDQRTAVDGSVSLTVAVNRDERVGANHALEAGGQLHIKAGATLVLEAGQRLTIKGPGGFIDIHPGGVDIVGSIVNINSGGAPGAGQGANPEAPLQAEEAHPKDTPSP
ncbi:type VI secretion system Vgr family protein [Sorangium sp. KYC3313]|uniref:type VI secretion system Vgr family protein n=1 Tax=Sorangium sp. KYC3313 TaxID=3449740 RepID=UPI003F8906E4